MKNYIVYILSMRGSPLEKLYKYKVSGWLTDEGFDIGKNVLDFIDEKDISDFTVSRYGPVIEIEFMIDDILIWIDIDNVINISRIYQGDYAASSVLNNLPLNQWNIKYLSNLI